MTKHVTNIVVTCTKRKSVTPDPYLCLGSVRDFEPMDITKSWLKRLRLSKGTRILATDLYQGDHWQVAKSLLNRDSLRSPIRLWVCSAGYGLIPANAQISPYSATFSSGQPDSVADRFRPNDVKLSVWWENLSRWSGPCKGEPRSLSALVSQDPRSRLFIVASGAYLSAMADDIEKARLQLCDSNGMLIFSGTGKLPGESGKNIIASDSKLQNLLGGALVSLNVRTLRWVLENIPPSRMTPTNIQEQLKAVANLQPTTVRICRNPLSDGEIKSFVSKWLAISGNASATSLLNDFRANGFACEQKRFRKIFQQVAESNCG
jgi:hypothetical protein